MIFDLLFNVAKMIKKDRKKLNEMMIKFQTKVHAIIIFIGRVSTDIQLVIIYVDIWKSQT